MTVEIYRDDKDINFRTLRIPRGAGFTLVKVFADYAQEVADKVMQMDLKPYIDRANKKGMYRNETEFREGVVDMAVEALQKQISDREKQKNNIVYQDGLG